MATRRRQDNQDQFGTWRKGLGTPQIKLSRSQGAPKVGPDEEETKKDETKPGGVFGPTSYADSGWAGLNQTNQSTAMANLAAGATGLPPSKANQLDQKTSAPGTVFEKPVFGVDKNNDGRITGDEIAAPYQFGRGRGALTGMRLGSMMAQKYNNAYAQLGAVLGATIRGLLDPEAAARTEYEEDLTQFYAKTEADLKLKKAEFDLFKARQVEEARARRDAVKLDLDKLRLSGKKDKLFMDTMSFAMSTMVTHYQSGLLDEAELTRRRPEITKDLKDFYKIAGGMTDDDLSYLDDPRLSSVQLLGLMQGAAVDLKYGIKEFNGFFTRRMANGLNYFITDKDGNAIVSETYELDLKNKILTFAENARKRNKEVIKNSVLSLEDDKKESAWQSALAFVNPTKLKNGQYSAMDTLRLKEAYAAELHKIAKNDINDLLIDNIDIDFARGGLRSGEKVTRDLGQQFRAPRASAPAIGAASGQPRTNTVAAVEEDEPAARPAVGSAEPPYNAIQENFLTANARLTSEVGGRKVLDITKLSNVNDLNSALRYVYNIERAAKTNSTISTKMEGTFLMRLASRDSSNPTGGPLKFQTSLGSFTLKDPRQWDVINSGTDGNPVFARNGQISFVSWLPRDESYNATTAELATNSDSVNIFLGEILGEEKIEDFKKTKQFRDFVAEVNKNYAKNKSGFEEIQIGNSAYALVLKWATSNETGQKTVLNSVLRVYRNVADLVTPQIAPGQTQAQPAAPSVPRNNPPRNNRTPSRPASRPTGRPNTNRRGTSA